MPINIQDDSTGEDKEVFTKEELETKAREVEEQYKKQLEEKETHYKTKIDEFVKGKQGVESKEKEVESKQKEWEDKIAEARKISEDAVQKVEAERVARFNALKNHIFEQYGGTDPDVKKKLEEKWELINVTITSDDDVKKRAQLTAELAGLNVGTVGTQQFIGGSSFGGGYAPSFEKKQGASPEEYNRFKSELGLDDIGKVEGK